MAITAADFSASISPNPVGIVLGTTGNVSLSFANTSSTEQGYNLTVQVVLPDGVSYVTSDISPDAITTGPGETLILAWTNIKDLAPNEVDYGFNLTLQADETFRSTGFPVSFDIPLISLDLTATVDTLPRGNDDPGNQKINSIDSANLIPLRYNLSKGAPGKIPKGAGLLSPPTASSWVYNYELRISNNTREPSVVTLVDNLPNGVRYLGNLVVSGPDAIALSSPTIITPVPGPGCQDFVTLDWGSVTLSASSENIISFEAAIWNNYTDNCAENTGDPIPHRTSLQNIAVLDGASGPAQAQASTLAMDVDIRKSVIPQNTDVNQVNNYTLTYRVNQYNDVGFFVITDTIGNGEEYNIGSASTIPSSITFNIDGTTTIVWNLGLLSVDTVGSITFTTTTKAAYIGGNPVSAGDTLQNDVDINGENQSTFQPTPDSAGTSQNIGIPTITKEILEYYYKDGTIKPFDVAAPGDMIEFLISYNSSGLTAEQMNVEIDEYAPINMGPLVDTITVIYGGTLPGPFSPVTVSPNGLRWSLGDLPGNTVWTAQFKVPVQNVDFVGARNNLAKQAGKDTSGFAYSIRDEVEVVFGEPNVELIKDVMGPNINAIKAGEIYTYSISVSNPQTLEGNVVDAFQMDLTDVIPEGLTFNGIFSVSGTGSYSPPVFSGQNVSMLINNLAPDENVSLSYEVIVNPSIVSGQILTNRALLQRPYSQPDRSYQYPGLPLEQQSTLKAEGITQTKFITPMFAKVGDEVSYLLQVTVPLGTTAFDVHVVDTFPASTQSFIPNSATKDGFPVFPVVGPGTVTFDPIAFVDATGVAVVIDYEFKVRITDAAFTPPYIDIQTDTSVVSWDLDAEGTPAVPFTVQADLQVRTPFLQGTKEQRNVTLGQNFRTSNVKYSVGDEIEYRISLTNNGADTAFGTELTDILDTLLSYQTGSISATLGSAIFAGGIITWNIPELSPGTTATLVFTVITLPGVAAKGRIPDSATFNYNTNDNGFGLVIGPESTNTVRLTAPQVNITKAASLSVGEIGDDITYTLTITVPVGTIAYGPVVDDTLPVGQTYIGPATREELPNPPQPVVPSLDDNTVLFPVNPDIDATSGTKIIIYTFVARITSALHEAPFQEIQTNETRVRWALKSGGPLRRSESAEFDIVARTPNVTVLKEQKKPSDSYTTENIEGLPGETVYYKLTINSNGASPAFSINLQDILSSKVTFGTIISGPTAGIVTPPSPPGPGGTLMWQIAQLNSGLSATLEFSVTINSGIAAGDSIPDSASLTYLSNDVNPITYVASSNEVHIDIPKISFSKIASTATATIGDTITYTLTATIPAGVLAYNLVITDSIPVGQEYVAGSWSPGLEPVVTGNTLVYSDPISPRIGFVVLIYTFATVVKSGKTDFPYTEIQRNCANVKWDISAAGPTISTVCHYADVEINSPHIISLKEQRNASVPGSVFTIGPIPGVILGDTIEYRITLTNDGTNPAYNMVTSDVLDNNLTYTGSYTTQPPGGVVNSSVPAGSPDGTLTWTQTTPLAPGGVDYVRLTFSVVVNGSPAPGFTILNQASTNYDTNSTNPTTLGPSLSNTVGFDYTLPEITKTVDDDSVIVGATVMYTVQITIPSGTTAYAVQVTDTLPGNQSYVPYSLTREGLPVHTPTLTFPFEGDIPGPRTITYTFEADVNAVSAGPQEKQTNTATILWNVASGGPAGEPQTASQDVYVTSSDLEVSKAQRNFTKDGPGPFTSEIIQVSPGDIVYYELTVTNLSSTDSIYNLVVTDQLEPLLRYQGIVLPSPSGVIIHTGETSDGTVEWSLPSLAPSASTTAVIKGEVLAGGGAQQLIADKIMGTFTATDNPPLIVYGPQESNTVDAQLPSLSIEKSTSSQEVEVGEIFQYNLILTVPEGTVAYNVVVSDTLPPQQNYAGEATRNGVAVFPTQVGQIITFPTEQFIDGTLGEVSIVYTFKARAVIGNPQRPYTEIQRNEVMANWEVNAGGEKATPVSSEEEILVKRPLLIVTKKQRNVTKDTGFVTSELAVEVGDLIHFKLEASNLGASSAYNVKVTDILAYDQYNGVVSLTMGNVSYNSVSKILMWDDFTVLPGDTEELIFEIEVLPGIGAGALNSNIAEATYDSNTVTPITYGPLSSNEVVYRYPNVEITKSPSLPNAVVGDIITYTVQFILPNGTIAYNAQFSDILPVGQIYNDNATLNGIPITAAEVVGQFVAFPIVPFASAIGGTQVYTYRFEAVIVSANVNPTSLVETQVDEAQGNWYLTPDVPAPSVNDTAAVNVTNSTMQIMKEQRNIVMSESFTTEPIPAYIEQIIEYRLTVANTGSNIIYNVTIEDILTNQLAYLNAVDVTKGTLVHSGLMVGGTVIWTISSLNPGESAQAVFAVKVLGEPQDIIHNNVMGKYQISLIDPTVFAAGSNITIINIINKPTRGILLHKVKHPIEEECFISTDD